MKRTHRIIAGSALVVGSLFASLGAAGTFAGATAVLPLVPTFTTVSSTDPFVSPVTLSAHVIIPLVTGLLVTPSGWVDFYDQSGENAPTTLGAAQLTHCLLGLRINGLLTETCTATLNYTGEGIAGCSQLIAYYSGDGDLLAQASEGKSNYLCT